MANTTLTTAVEIDVNAKDGGSVKSIKQQLSEAKNEAIQMAVQFGELSPQAVAAADRVAKLRDRVEDLGIQIKGLNPDKFQRIATFASGIANGFTAAQGAVALFGGQSEELTKTLIKLQGAIALSQGLQGVKDLALTFSGLGKVIQTEVVAAFSTLRGALLATGIGALTIAVGILIERFVQLQDEEEAAAKASEDRIKKAQELAKEIDDIDKKYDAQRKDELKRVEDDVKKQEDLYAMYKENRLQILNDGRQKELAAEEIANDKRIEEANKLGFNLELVEQLHQKEIAAIYKKYNDIKIKDQQDFYAEQERIRRLNEDQERQRAQLKKDEQLAASNAELKAAEDLYGDLKTQAEAAAVGDVKLTRNLHMAELKLLDEKYTVELQDTQISEEAKTEIERKQKALRVQIKKEEFDAKKEIQDLEIKLVAQSFDALTNLAATFADKSKTAFEIHKALSIASATVNTYEAAVAAYKNGLENPLADAFPGGGIALGTIQAGIAIANGFATIAKIQQTKFNSPASGSSSTFSGQQAPSLSTPTNQQRSIIGNLTGSTGQGSQTNVTKVIVTETDITKSQNRVNEIKRRAVIK